MPYSHDSVSAFAAAVGAGTPAPAGGSATAVAGALAAALAELAARVSGAEPAAAQAEALRERLLALADEDAEAYAAFLETRGGSERSRTVDVPLEIAEATAAVGELAARLARDGQVSVRGDALAAADLARAAVVAAARLVGINLGRESDERGARALELARAARRSQGVAE